MTSAYLMALLYAFAGITHLVTPKFFEKIIPPYLPNPKSLVILSGIAELVLGVALVFDTTQRLAAWGIILLLVAVFPANLYMAQSDRFRAIPTWIRWIRLPLQLVLIAWAYRFT